MLWLIVAIFSHFLFAIVVLVDKYLLVGLLPSPRIYAFYVGALGILALALFPFGFFVPSPEIIIFAVLAGSFHIVGVIVYFSGLKRFEASRVVPAIGGFSPLFILGLTYLFLGERTALSLPDLTAFLLLIAGSILISWEKSKNITLKTLSISALAALLFSFYFVLAKIVYLAHPFISGFIWSRVGAFLVAAALLFFKDVRQELFMKQKTFDFKTWKVLLPNQIASSGAYLSQNWAIALAGVSYIAFIQALTGIQYAILLIFALFFSVKLPQFIREEISRKILFQKISAILLIGLGLAFLVFK